MSTQAPPSQATRYMQGIAVPASSVNPREFFARTRRQCSPDYNKPFAGLGQTDVVEVKQTGVVAGFFVRFDGSVTVTPGSGTVSSLARWPYDLLKRLRFTANGQSNVIDCSGLKLKVREFMARGDLSDRGVPQSVNGATVQNGTLAQASESWGVGSRAASISGGTYDLDLEWFVPVAEDQVDLAGAIFAATASTELVLNIDWANQNEIFALTGNGAVAVTGQVQVQALRYSIPLGADGQIVVPDLSVFHSLQQSRITDFSTGLNEKKLVGQGAGKTLLRLYSQLWNGTVPVPLALNEDNFGQMAWRFSTNESPDEYPDGQMLRLINERMYNVDIGAVWGFWSHEFASENAFRDAVDLGTTSEWRQVLTIQSGVTLTNPAMEYVAETLFAAGAGA